MSLRSRSLCWLSALLMLAVPQAVAHAAPTVPDRAPSRPLLWSGQVVDRRGVPTAAQVVAVLRPPASAIPTLEQRTPAPPSIPLASSATGRDGRFELRADLPPVPDSYRPAGWLQVMLLAQADDGSWAIANDSVRYVPAGRGQRAGVWASTMAGLERIEGLRSARPPLGAPALERVARADQSGGYERPSVIELGEPRPAAAAVTSARWKGPGAPYTGCSARYVEDRQEGLRTISDIDVGPAWSYVIDYTDTASTSWDIGVEQSGGGWKAGGTSSFSSSLGAGFNAEYGPYGQRFREAYQVQLVHAKVLWQCASQSSPGPFYVRTVEAESWTGGTFNQGDPVVPCNPSFRKPVAGRTFGWRKEGTVSRYSATATAFGFNGKAAVGYSKDIKLGWKNHLGHPRDACGESGNPYYGHTRVAAMDEHR